MDNGLITVYCGYGKGKTTLALGQGIRAASAGKSVIVIQFLKSTDEETLTFLRKLEPEIKLFRFEKCACDYNELSDEEKEDEIQNIRNGLHYARKVLSTGECQLLILDEILGLLDMEIISYEDLKSLLEEKDEETELVLTGKTMCDSLKADVQEIYEISQVQ